MQVTLEQGGGVAGRLNHRRLGPVDTQRHTGGKQVEELVRELDFFGISHDFPRPGVKTDPAWTSIRVAEGDGDRTIRWDSNQQPPVGLKQLVEVVTSLGEWQRVT